MTDAGQTDLKTRYLALRDEIAAHNRAYHEQDAPTIPDSEYDQLVKEMRALQRQYHAVAGLFGRSLQSAGGGNRAGHRLEDEWRFAPRL